MEFQTKRGTGPARDRIAQLNRQIAASLDARDWNRARVLVEEARTLALRIEGGRNDLND